jgi:hypothetical protein
VARTPAERATLEKQWQGMVEAVAAMRQVPVEPATPPALSFAALRRPARDARAPREPRRRAR